MITYIRKSLYPVVSKSLSQKNNIITSHNQKLASFTNSLSPIMNFNLSLKIVQPFTIKNYMKTYELQNVQRTEAHLEHGIFRVDQFKKFASDKDSVQEFITEQNKKYEQTSKRWQPRTKKYYQLTSQRRDTRTSSSQQQYDDYSYFTSVKYIEEKEYTVIHRRHNKTRKQQVALDIMQYYSLKKHFRTIDLTRTAFSSSHRYIAFGYDLNNNEYIRWMVKDTKENKILGVKGWEGNVLQNVGEVVFYQDKGLFYTKTENRRPCKLYYQEFDSEPQLIFEEKDPSSWLYIEISKDKSHLIISSTSKSSTKVKCLQLPSEQKFSFTAKNSTEMISEITSSSPNEKLQVNHCSDYMVIWRQNQLKNTISIKKDGQNAEQVIHTLNPQESLTDHDIFEGFIVLYIQRNTKPIIRMINTKQNFTIQQPQLPYPIGKITPGMNQVYNAQSFLFYISTPFIYNQGYTYNSQMKTFQVSEKFQITGPKFKHNNYQAKTIEIPSLDGELIPLTILSQKRSTQYPKKLIIKVYGFYGLPNEVSYCNMNYALLENGWTIVYAHVRGGGDKGKQWHSKAFKDKNIIWSDLEDCVAYLLREKYTHPSLLFLESHSAGAITVWNIINKSSHLFKGVVMKYPFLDVLNTLIDPKDPLSASDHAQFGNPQISKRAFRQIESISPYENIQEKPYPFIYIVGGQNDYRCPVEQLAKFVRRYRQLAWTNNRYSQKIADKGILLKVYDDASHLGSSDIGKENYNNCEVYGFLDYLVYEASNDCKY